MARKSLLTQGQWRKIQMRYEGGDRIKDIARDWKISSPAISQRAKKEGWIHGNKLVKEEIIKRAREKVVEGTADQQANRIRKYLQSNMKRAGDMYKILDLQLFTLAKISKENFLKAQDAETEAAQQQASAQKAELAKAAVEGREPGPVNRVPVDMPDMGRTTLDARRLVECFGGLDTVHRRILGLDGHNSTEDQAADPLEGWLGDLADMRKKYHKDKAERKEMLEDLVKDTKQLTKGNTPEGEIKR